MGKAHIQHEWIYERTEGHGFYEEGHRTELLTSMIGFLDRNIGSSAAH